MAFAKKCGVALTHHHGDFFELWHLGAFYLMYVCQNSFVVQMYASYASSY